MQPLSSEVRQEGAPVAKGRWAQRLNQEEAKENSGRKVNEGNKRRYTLEPDEIASKRQRTDGFSSHDEDLHTLVVDPLTHEADLKKQPERLDYVEGEKSELEAKQQPCLSEVSAPATDLEEELVDQVAEDQQGASEPSVVADENGFESSVHFLENLHKPLAEEDLARASSRKTLTKGFLKEVKVHLFDLFDWFFEVFTEMKNSFLFRSPRAPRPK